MLYCGKPVRGKRYAVTMLHKRQDRFKRAMLRLRPAVQADLSLLDADFEVSDGAALAARAEIYHNNILGTLARGLADKFPLLEALVGRDYLMLCARGFVIEHPPREGCLLLYGTGFDAHLASMSGAADFAYLVDIARLEIAFFQSAHAPDDFPLTRGQLAAMAPDTLADAVLPLRASGRLVRSSYDLPALVALCQDPPKDITIPLQERESFVLVLRGGLDVDSHVLGRAEYEILAALSGGDTLGSALERALALDSSFDMSAFLERHLALGSLCFT